MIRISGRRINPSQPYALGVNLKLAIATQPELTKLCLRLRNQRDDVGFLIALAIETEAEVQEILCEKLGQYLKRAA